MKTWVQYILCLLLAGCGMTPATPNASGVPDAAATATPVLKAQPAWHPVIQNFLPSSARLIDSSEVDTDGDAITELLVIYQERGIGRGLVIRRAGEDGRAYGLGGSQPTELFQEKWTANTVRDINGDGKVEVLVEGVVAGTTATVNVFQWNGNEYVTLLSLRGSEGVAIDDPQARDILDFTALQLVFQRSAIMRATHAEWNRTAYEVNSDVLFLLGAPAKYTYPEEAALAFYVFLDKHEPAPAHALLGEPQKSRMPLKAVEELSQSVDSVDVERLSVDEEKTDSAQVTLSVRMVEHASQRVQSAQYVWRLKKAEGQWTLAELLMTGSN